MPENSINKLFKAIADPTRREIFHVLVFAASSITITQLSEQFDMSRQGVTKHVKYLEDAGLVSLESSGRERFCVAHPAPLKEVNQWIGNYEQFWDKALSRLDKHLDNKA